MCHRLVLLETLGAGSSKDLQDNHNGKVVTGEKKKQKLFMSAGIGMGWYAVAGGGTWFCVSF